MSSTYGIQILGTGSYTPERILTNEDLERMVDTSDEWIQTRTGIRERRIARADQPTSALATEAAKRALEAAGKAPGELDLIIVATLTPDNRMPNTACHVQRNLGALNAACFSLEAACSGFLYGLQAAADMIRCGTFKTALVVGAEKLSSVTDWTDRNTCVLFGDAAGAVVVSACPVDEDCLLASYLRSNGEYADLLQIPAGGSALPLTPELILAKDNCIRMAGREIFKLALAGMVGSSKQVLEAAGIGIEALRWLVPHQANLRIIKAVGQRLNIPEERVFVNLEHYGNTSAATIPLALDEIVRGDLVEQGEYLLLTAFGGGLTWGAQLLRW